MHPVLLDVLGPTSVPNALQPSKSDLDYPPVSNFVLGGPGLSAGSGRWDSERQTSNSASGPCLMNRARAVHGCRNLEALNLIKLIKPELKHALVVDVSASRLFRVSSASLGLGCRLPLA